MVKELNKSIDKLKEIDNNLKEITYRIANEIRYKELGPAFKFLQLILNNVRDPAFVISSKSMKILYANKAAKKIVKEKLGKTNIVGKPCYHIFNRDKMCEDCLVFESIKEKKVMTRIIQTPNHNPYVCTCIPLIYNGVSAVIEILDEYEKD